jgi:hypothetical protein
MGPHKLRRPLRLTKRTLPEVVGAAFSFGMIIGVLVLTIHTHHRSEMLGQAHATPQIGTYHAILIDNTLSGLGAR